MAWRKSRRLPWESASPGGKSWWAMAAAMRMAPWLFMAGMVANIGQPFTFFLFFFLKTSEDILARMKQGHASKPAVPMSNMQTTRTWRRRLSEACLFLPQLSNFRPFDATATQVELRWTANSFSDRHCAAMALLQFFPSFFYSLFSFFFF